MVDVHEVEHAPLTENKGHTERQEGPVRAKRTINWLKAEREGDSDAMIERAARKMITRQAATERNYPRVVK